MNNDTPLPKKKRTFGVTGVLLGFIALAAAFLSPWIQRAIDPPPKPIEERAVNFAGRLAEAAKAKMKGETYSPASVAEPLPSRFVVPSVIGLGMVAVGLGIVSLLASEHRPLGSSAIALGVSAAVVQWSLVVAGAILLLLLVFAVMSAFGG
jgi:hypothetical protein